MNAENERVQASIRGNSWVIECAGDLDQATATRLHRTIAWCLSTSNIDVELDLSRAENLSREAMSVILNGMVSGYQEGVGFTVHASAVARAQLDEAGLWWVGVLDDGISAELAMGDAFQDHLDQHRLGDGSF